MNALKIKNVQTLLDQKTDQKLEAFTTSVLILERHRTYIKDRRLNLSQFLRDLIDSLIYEDLKNESNKTPLIK